MHKISNWICLVLCAILAFTWLVSGWHAVKWNASEYGAQYLSLFSIECSSGGIRVRSLIDKDKLSGWLGPPDGWGWSSVPNGPRWKLGFDYKDSSFGGFFKGWELFVPLWAPLLMCVLLTVVAWRGRDTRSSDCPCGYSRFGLAENACCPECGQVPASGVSRQMPPSVPPASMSRASDGGTSDTTT